MVPNKKIDQYLKRIALGDKEALTNLYYETKDAIYGYALSIVKNKDLAQDAMQETYINIYNKSDSYSSKDKPMSWIFTITKNNALMQLRKEKNTTNIDLLENILSNKNNIDNKLFLSYIFKNVSDSDRQIVILHAVAGFKHREIAKMLNLPLGTVLAKYKRTLNKLKEIGRDYYEK